MHGMKIGKDDADCRPRDILLSVTATNQTVVSKRMLAASDPIVIQVGS
jgi:hypothetical protein